MISAEEIVESINKSKENSVSELDRLLWDFYKIFKDKLDILLEDAYIALDRREILLIIL